MSNFLTGQDAGFEGGLGNWIAAGLSTIAASTAAARSGSGSMAITATGAGYAQAASCAGWGILTLGMPVAPGVPVAGSAWFRADAVAASCYVHINFYDATGASLADAAGASVADSTAGWVQASVGATAPANAAFCRLLVLCAASGAGEVHYVDDAQLLPLLSYDSVLAAVEIDLTVVRAAAGSDVSGTVQRSADQVRWATVRGGTGVAITATSPVLRDYEFADGAANYYRVVLTGVSYDFESGTASWTATHASVATSSAWAASGSQSLAATSDGTATTDWEAASPGVAVSPGDTASFSGKVHAPSGLGAVAAFIDFYDAAAVFLSRASSASGKTTAIGAGGTATAGLSAMAPAGAATFRCVISDGEASAAGTLMLIDAVTATSAASSATYTDSITPALSGVWLKSLRYAFLNTQVSPSDAGDVTRASRSGVFDVQGRTYPVAVTQVRGAGQFTLTLATETSAERDAVRSAVASGDVLLIQAAAGSGYQLDGGYYLVGDVTETRQGVAWDRRWITLALTEVAAPSPDIVPVTVIWQSVVNAYATWADVVAGLATWADVLALTGAPDDVIVP